MARCAIRSSANTRKILQRRPNGSPDALFNNMQGIEPLPYRLPELLGDPDAVIFIPEGEKDCDNLAEIGILATCNHGGAGKWRNEISQWLKNRHVVILPDNDDAGRAHADDIAKKLTSIAASIKRIELPGLPPKGDVSDWLAGGGTANQLDRLAAAAPAFTTCSSLRLTSAADLARVNLLNQDGQSLPSLPRA